MFALKLNGIMKTARYWSKDGPALEIQHLSAKKVEHKCFEISFGSMNGKNFSDRNHCKP